MAAKWIEVVTGSLEQKKQYRQAKSRLDALPEPYRRSALAVHRYLLYYSGMTGGDTITRMFVDLADLWERAFADGTAVGDIVGADPVEFVETFARAYDGRQWIDKERARLLEEINTAKRQERR